MGELASAMSVVGFQLVNGDSLDHVPDRQLLESTVGFCDKSLDARKVSSALIDEFGSISAIAAAQVSTLLRTEGVSVRLAGFIKYLHVLEVRSRQSVLPERVVINGYEQLRSYLMAKWSHKRTEEFVVFFLDNGYRIIRTETLAHGGVDNAVMDPRDVVKRALQLEATCLVVAHNHPSGRASPSRTDLVFTQKLALACQSLNIALDDHVIFGADQLYSFRANGQLHNQPVAA